VQGHDGPLLGAEVALGVDGGGGGRRVGRREAKDDAGQVEVAGLFVRQAAIDKYWISSEFHPGASSGAQADHLGHLADVTLRGEVATHGAGDLEQGAHLTLATLNRGT